MRVRPLLATLGLAAAVRAPLWVIALRAGLDGDTAIVGLMALHPTRGTTLWGQPYGSPLDGWVAAPFVAALGTTTAALRLPGALLALALVGLTHGLAEAVRRGAGTPAALLVATGPAYLLLLSALPPPLYPTSLVLLALVLLLTVRTLRALEAGETVPAGRLAALGAAAGLAVWTHLMSLATVAAVAGALALAAAGRGRVGRARLALWVLAPFLLASAPWWGRAARAPEATAVLGLAYEGRPPLAHAGEVLRRLHEPVAALLGAWTPLTADEGERWVRAPAVVGGLAVAGWLLAAGLGLVRARGRSTGLLAAAAILTVAAFPFPVRSDAYTVRFLTPAVVPLAVLAGLGASSLARPGRAWPLVLPLCAAQLWTGALLLGAWRRAGPGALAPDCAPVRALLARRGVDRAYASYHTAYCLTYASGETIVASQPWNERFYGEPLPYLDEVRFATRVAWVLVPGVDFGLPAPRTFESKLSGIGGRYARETAGPAVAYLDFVPPFAPEAAAGVLAGPAGDGDVATRVLEPGEGPALFALAHPVAGRGITVLSAPGRPHLPAAFTVESSADGTTFERIARRRPGRETVDLAWVNGHPQFLVDSLVFSTPLDGRPVAAVRITPDPGAPPWGVAEVLVHPVAGMGPWPAGGTAGSWAARRAALAAPPPRHDAGGLFRSLLALRHP